ncbi:hypothetical protein E2562_027980 [Oryza meyeriana var. granulata]|uniref:Uncharacterized protein n=1 Tax=Oryza meyeriana var. granulata TaxID=110450 RepID=A0A6G1CUJ5_9ORYZ|nr:hypothetical protein E2562_027980 [Oryza meyeriana var. granulata]
MSLPFSLFPLVSLPREFVIQTAKRFLRPPPASSLIEPHRRLRSPSFDLRRTSTYLWSRRDRGLRQRRPCLPRGSRPPEAHALGGGGYGHGGATGSDYISPVHETRPHHGTGGEPPPPPGKDDYSLAVRDGKHWVKDMKYNKRVKDEEGYPSTALVNKATGKATGMSWLWWSWREHGVVVELAPPAPSSQLGRETRVGEKRDDDI